jgi:hypothetical protein
MGKGGGSKLQCDYTRRPINPCQGVSVCGDRVPALTLIELLGELNTKVLEK